jgi:dTDP-4-dehydrorhamnose 3,5-epimerase
MKFTETRIGGAWIVELEPLEDSRGHFARSFCRREFADHGLRTQVDQCNVSYNARRGTLRGMHYQIAPRAEAKLVRCTRGSLLDVVLDLRPDSPTRLQWEGVSLGADRGNRRTLYVPEGCAHGFQTLEDDTEVLYVMFGEFSPEHARGVRFDDPAFSIQWPVPDPIVSEKDRSFPLLAPVPAR